jgi:protein SDA1
LRTTRGEDEASGDGEDEDGAWEGWEIGSESSDDSSDSGGWIDVDDGGDHLDVSDSDDEDGKDGDELRKDDGSADDVNRTSTLATTKVCGRAILNEPFDRSDVSPRP